MERHMPRRVSRCIDGLYTGDDFRISSVEGNLVIIECRLNRRLRGTDDIASGSLHIVVFWLREMHQRVGVRQSAA